jgi:hypothetical protein
VYVRHAGAAGLGAPEFLTLPPGSKELLDRSRRPAILADGDARLALLGHALVAVVAVLAQALQLAGQESVPITAMRLDVVDDGCRPDQTALQAHGAERRNPELVPAQATPALELVPGPGIVGPRCWSTVSGSVVSDHMRRR